MPQSFNKRFAGREQEVVDEIKLFGEQEFCKHEGTKGFALQEWFQKQPGHEKDSIYHYRGLTNSISGLSSFKQLMLDIQAGDSKLLQLVSNLEDRLAEAHQRNELLERQLRESKLSHYERFKPLFEFVRNRGDPIT